MNKNNLIKEIVKYLNLLPIKNIKYHLQTLKLTKVCYCPEYTLNKFINKEVYKLETYCKGNHIMTDITNNKKLVTCPNCIKKINK